MIALLTVCRMIQAGTKGIGSQDRAIILRGYVTFGSGAVLNMIASAVYADAMRLPGKASPWTAGMAVLLTSWIVLYPMAILFLRIEFGSSTSSCCRMGGKPAGTPQSPPAVCALATDSEVLYSRWWYCNRGY